MCWVIDKQHVRPLQSLASQCFDGALWPPTDHPLFFLYVFPSHLSLNLPSKKNLSLIWSLLHPAPQLREREGRSRSIAVHLAGAGDTVALLFFPASPPIRTLGRGDRPSSDVYSYPSLPLYPLWWRLPLRPFRSLPFSRPSRSTRGMSPTHLPSTRRRE
jgi:hypothetical protein